ncbi:MAG: hypothetical protein FWE38_02405 [Firmicutes bacterium]|nr:hypothetical protein [Bacillota bacterium]
MTQEAPIKIAGSDELFILVLIPKLQGFSMQNPYELDICGRTMQGWLDNALQTFHYRKVEASTRDDIITLVRRNLTRHKYIMVIYADMPLLRSETIESALSFATMFGHRAVRLPRGWLFEQEFIREATKVEPVTAPDLIPEDFLAVYNYARLADATQIMQARINGGHLANGVRFIDTSNVHIGAEVVLEPGVMIEPSTIISGKVHVKSGSRIGPFATVRSGTRIGRNCRIGNFVEIKNSIIGDGTKIAHHAYVGDAQIGVDCNVGCGVVFCNFDGKQKHKTVVGDRVFLGSNVNLVAPLLIDDDAIVAAGSTITDNVPAGSLAIARERQTVKDKRGGPATEIVKEKPKLESKPEPKQEPISLIAEQMQRVRVNVKPVVVKPEPKPEPVVEIIPEPEPIIEVVEPELEPIVEVIEVVEVVEEVVVPEPEPAPIKEEPTPEVFNTKEEPIEEIKQVEEPEPVIEEVIEEVNVVEVEEESIDEPEDADNVSMSFELENDIYDDENEDGDGYSPAEVVFDWDNEDDVEPFYEQR